MDNSSLKKGNFTSKPDQEYNIPDNYDNIDELAAKPAEQNPDEGATAQNGTLDGARYAELGVRSTGRRGLAKSKAHASGATKKRQPTTLRADEEGEYSIPHVHTNLGDLNKSSSVENPRDENVNQHQLLEQRIFQDQDYERNKQHKSAEQGKEEHQDDKKTETQVSRNATQLYVISYLILFSILGTLARLGLQAITFYPGAPIVFSELWANFGGSVVMGFLTEDRMLFKHEWGTATYHQKIQQAKQKSRDEEVNSDKEVGLQAAKRAHVATKRTIPLYIGLTTGFCGCFTSFSSFIRDIYFALANDMPTPLDHPSDFGSNRSMTSSTVPRSGGYSFMASLAVILGTVTICISGLHFGAHLAIAAEPYTPSIPLKLGRKVLDRICVFLAWGCWLGAVLLAILPPDRKNSHHETWRGRAVFALVFAPLGCLGRFYTSILFNSRIASFPLGTFVVNIFGTIIVGMCYDFQHVPLGGVIGCQILQGIMDGFCGCLTTISTWVDELSLLRRNHAYRYGTVSVVVALCFLVVIMGSLQWTEGFSEVMCTH